MKRFFRQYWKPLAAIAALGVISIATALVILVNQRFYLPKYVPVLGRDLVTYEAEFSTAQSVTPGQGQIVSIAGVRVGDITDVQLEDGRAIVEMKIERRYIYLLRQDASALLRPKTGLKDMTLQLDPGTKAAPRAREGFRIPVARTAPNVDPDQFLAALDGDTRDYLQLLLAAGADGLRGRGEDFGNALRQFDPLSRDLRRATDGLAERRRNISGGITSVGQITEALGDSRGDLNTLISSSADVFASFANQEASLRRALNDLPPALLDTRRALAGTRTLADDLGPASTELRPLARELGPALRAVRPFVRRTEPVVREQLLPFTRETLPAVRDLRNAARDVNRAMPDTIASFEVVNDLLDILAYDPPGEEEGYLFYFAWVNHLGANVFTSQDAHGPIRRGQLILSCTSLGNLDLAPVLEPLLGPVLQLTNPPDRQNTPACNQDGAAPARTVRISETPPEEGEEREATARDDEPAERAAAASRRAPTERDAPAGEADRRVAPAETEADEAPARQGGATSATPTPSPAADPASARATEEGQP